MFDNTEVIYAYTRQQAIQDGMLIDVTETAKDAGFKYPVAVTEGLWKGYIIPPAGVADDTEGRLWDVLFMAYLAIRSTKNPPNPMLFGIYTDADCRCYRLQLRHPHQR